MARHDHPGTSRPPVGSPLIEGPRWYRTRIRVLGPFLGLLPMAVLGGASWGILKLGEGRTSGIAGLVTGVSAAPGLLVVGAPFADEARYPMAIAASVPLWLLLGLLASRRATRRIVASWRDYWRELLVLAIAVVVGAIGALVVATMALGETLVT